MVKNKLKGLRYVEWATGILVLSVVSLLVIASNTHKNPTIHNATGVNEQVNYQGRLLTNTGAVVPDGTYNMEFKIYQDGNGVLGGGDETLEWTETRTSGNKVTVKNGYFSVYLGAVTAFGSSIDWNQDTLWLSINIGGTGSPSWDGEMSPFSRFSSTPYALNSKALNGLASSNFVQLAQGTQTDGSSTNASISINKTAGTANLLELLRGGTSVVTVSNGGATTFQNQTNSTAAFQLQNVAGDQLLKIDTATTENLITNGQFETNTTGWAAKGAAGSPSQSTSQHYLGNGSMQFTTTAAANDGVKYNYALTSQTNYTMTFYVKTSTLISAVSTINIGRTEDGSTDSDCATGQTVLGSGWTKLTCTFTTGNVSGTNNIYLKQSDATARTIYIDSAQLQTSTNLVSNPDLEVDDSGWDLYSSPTTAQTTAESYTGSGSLQVDTTGIAATEGVTVAPTVQPNTTYSASFWVKTDAATVGSKTFGLYKRFDSTDTTSTSCGSASLSPGVWTNISCTFTTGSITANTPYIGPVVNDNGTPLTYYVDTANVSIAKYNSNDIGRISLNAAIDSPLTVRGAQDSTSALQVQQQNGKTILKVDTLNGFVGIGTDTATKTLQVDGKALIRATNSDTDTFQVANSATIGATNSVIFNVGANSRAVSVGLGSNTLNTNLNVYGTQLINTRVNNANALRITDASGIGALTFSTTSGNRKLSIGGTGTGNDGKFAVSNSNGDTVFDLDSSSTGSVQFNSDYFDILTTTGNQLYLDSSVFFVGGVSGTTSYNDSTGVFEVSDGSGTTGLYYDIISSRLGLGANYNTPGYTLDVGGDINVGSGSVYRVAGTAGSTTTCSGGQFLQNQVVVGGITTGGTCVAGGGGGVTTVGTFSGSSIANGASISGSTITFGPADGTNPGMVTTGSQTFAGAKTFNAAIAANGGITFDNSTDTIGAFTNGGTQDAANNLILNIGNAGTDFTSGGGLTLAGNLIANGDTTLGDAATDGLTFTGEIRNASALTFEGATNNNIYTIFSITDPTSSNKTITFADATGTVLLHSMISSDATVTSAGVLTIAANAIGASEVTDGTLTTSDLSASAGILNAQLANSGITVTAGSGLVTGGAVSLGGSVTLDIGAGNGITVNANDITIDLTAATDGLSATTSSSSGLEVLSSGVTLLQGCADAQVLQWNEASDVWQCATAGGSGVTTVGTFSGSSIANGASIAGNTITFGPADGTNPGMVTTGAQTFAGLKTFGAGLTVSGGTATINTSANNTSIGNGSGTLTLTGSSASTFVINAVTIDATEFNRLNGTTAALVDQDDFISGDGAGATSSGSGLEAGTGGIGLLQGCANGQTLKWNEASSIWECGSDRATSQNRLSGNYTNTTTGFTDVDDNATGNSDMAFAVGTNETWIFEAVLYANAPAAADIKFQVTCPAGSTGVLGFENSEDTVNVGNIACGASSGTLNTDGAANVYRVSGTIVTNGTAGTVMVQAGQVIASGTTTILAGSYITAYKVSGADLAEIYYSKNGSIQPGTVVVADSSIAAGVKSSSNAYAKGIVGVVSTQPGMVLGNSDATGTPVPLALSGRVPVKVSTENGSIKPGDQLTSSSIPGVAMKATKAGTIIGQALTAYDGQGVGEVTVFIKTSYGLGGSVSDLANGSSSTDPSFAQNVLAGLMTNQVQPDAVNLSELITDRLVAGLEVITPRVTSDEVALNSIKPIGSVIQINGDVSINGTLTADTIKANRIEGLDLFVEKAVIASSTSAQSISQGASSEDDEVPTAESNIANLTVQSADISSNLSVGGGLTVAGPAEFKGNAIFYKLVTFVEKTIFKNDVTFEGRVAFNSDTGGFAVIKTGQDRVRVVFEQPYQQVPVVTVNVKNGVFVQYAYTELTGTGFTVVLKEPATQDVEFAWTAISVNNARTAQAN